MNLRLAIVTSIPSPHQIPLANAIFALAGESFRIVFTSPLDYERRKLGWKERDDESPFVLHTWNSDDAKQRLREILRTYDAVLYGAVPTEMVRERILAGKLTFRYMERPFKRGLFLGFLWWFNRLRKELWPLDLPNHHLLAAGAYCARDLSLVRLFLQRQWKWGYFTPVSNVAPPAKLDLPVNILWAGRMFHFKGVDLLLQATRDLHIAGKKFTLTLIGDGPEKKGLIHYVQKNHMQGYVTFHPPVPIDKVCDYMLCAKIYVMPSNFREGWGAVINEAMASGCCVVSSTGPGAAPWLIDHGKSGYLFKNGNLKELIAILSLLIDDTNRCQDVGLNAWEKIRTLWSPAVAAERLISLTSGLIGSATLPIYSDGPCSRA